MQQLAGWQPPSRSSRLDRRLRQRTRHCLIVQNPCICGMGVARTTAADATAPDASTGTSDGVCTNSDCENQLISDAEAENLKQ
jgi:hypothetical protein